MSFFLFQFYLFSIPSATFHSLIFSTPTAAGTLFTLLNLPKLLPLGLRRLHGVHLDASRIGKEATLA